MNLQKIEIYTDGACKGNPGPGGYGTILVYRDNDGKEYKKEIREGFKRTTNNRMEILAAIKGLESLNKPCNVKIYSDSQYLVKAFNEPWIDGWIGRDWLGVANTDLWKRLLEVKSKHEVEFIWVKGHAGHKYNERCDFLARLAASQSEDSLLEDINYK